MELSNGHTVPLPSSVMVNEVFGQPDKRVWVPAVGDSEDLALTYLADQLVSMHHRLAACTEALTVLRRRRTEAARRSDALPPQDA